MMLETCASCLRTALVLTNRLPSDSGLPSSNRTFDGPSPVWVMAVLIGLQLLGENSSSETTLLAMSKSSSPRAKHFQIIHPNILFLMHCLSTKTIVETVEIQKMFAIALHEAKTYDCDLVKLYKRMPGDYMRRDKIKIIV